MSDPVLDDLTVDFDTALKMRQEARQVCETHEADEPLPAFPESAWRGVFGDYRAAMNGTTEAPEPAHFATLWAAIAAALGRRVWMYSGDCIYPNVYLSVVGPTGSKKTTAMRRLFQCNLVAQIPHLQVIRNVGSTEGLTNALQRNAEANFQGCTYLLFWEELSALLARGTWSGSTIFEFITETFDCPPEWGLSYKNSPVTLKHPTPTILCGTTPEWFWKGARAEDFYGGFCSRFLFIMGPKKALLPNPNQPVEDKVRSVRERISVLPKIRPCRAMFNAEADRLWEAFYRKWEGHERTGLVEAALKRVHVYVRKLAMVYAAVEETLPEVTLPQLQAAIAVGLYGAKCGERLIDMQATSMQRDSELEERFIKWIKNHEGERLRVMQQRMWRYTGGCERFNRVVKNLLLADRIELREKRVFLAR